MRKTTTTTKPDANNAPRSSSKLAAVIELLSQPHGASLDDLTRQTGWQKHTARARLTGLKKTGYVLERTAVEGVSRYRIISRAGQ